MTGERSADATFFNMLANDSEIRPWIGGDGVSRVDLTGVIERPDVVAWAVKPHGGFFAVPIFLGLYEVHSMFLRSGRGKLAVTTMRAGLRYMFCSTDCIEIATRVPTANKAALGLARLGGFVRSFALDNDPLFGGRVDFYSLTLDRWRQTEPALNSGAGEMEEAALRARNAARLMVDGGNPHKASFYYNRWASLAGFPPMENECPQPSLSP